MTGAPETSQYAKIGDEITTDSLLDPAKAHTFWYLDGDGTRWIREHTRSRVHSLDRASSEGGKVFLGPDFPVGRTFSSRAYAALRFPFDIA